MLSFFFLFLDRSEGPESGLRFLLLKAFLSLSMLKVS